MKILTIINFTALLCIATASIYADNSLTNITENFNPNFSESHTNKTVVHHPMTCQQNGNTETCHSSSHETKVTTGVSGQVNTAALASSALNLLESNLNH